MANQIRAAPVERAPLRDEGALGDVRPLLWTLGIAKLVTVGVIFWASRSFSTAGFLAAMTWHWLPVAAALGGGWVVFRWRLVRVRAKRESLRRAEWVVGDAGVGP